jgi:hypothetical protein
MPGSTSEQIMANIPDIDRVVLAMDENAMTGGLARSCGNKRFICIWVPRLKTSMKY